MDAASKPIIIGKGKSQHLKQINVFKKNTCNLNTDQIIRLYLQNVLFNFNSLHF